MNIKRKRFEVLMRTLMFCALGLTAALVLFLLVYVLVRGLPHITWELLSTSPSYLTGRIGILPDILNTVYIVLATLCIVLLLGVGAAIHLTEYATNKKLVGIIEYAAETLSGIPSIIYGLVGMLLFSNNIGTCLMAGALTLVIMNLPTVMRTTQESLKTVPLSYREGAFGLGAGKWRVVRTAQLCGWGRHGVHSVGRPNSRRIGSTAFYRGLCSHAERHCGWSGISWRNADRCPLCLC